MGKGGKGIEPSVGAPGAAAVEPEVPDRVELVVPRDGRVVVTSDLHLTRRASAASTAATEALARALAATSAPGVVVLAGDCFEMLAGPDLDPGPALDAHPALARALGDWGARADRWVVVLPGNHDGALAWHPAAVDTVRRRLGATVALAADLDLDTGAGVRRVRVEHGHQLDPANAFVDPRDPAETPLGHHVVQDVLPQLGGITGAGWAAGLELMADPFDLPPAIASRFAYRRLLPALGWAALPVALAAVLGLAVAVGAPAPVGIAAAVAGVVALAVVVAVVGGAVFWGGLGWRSVRPATLDVSGGAEPGNDGPRRRAQTLAGEGVVAYVTGHTHIPELTARDGVLYANSGCGGGLLHRRPGRGPLPAAFSVARHVSWVELDAGPDLEARLWVGFEEGPGPGRVERWATRPAAPAPAEPTVVASVVGVAGSRPVPPAVVVA